MHQGPLAVAPKRGTAIKPAPTGLCAGTILLTLDGEVPVEHLVPGDRVITRDCGMAVLREVRVTRVDFKPIRIKAGSLGHSRPNRDTATLPGAHIHIRDWRAQALFGAERINIEALALTDGTHISEDAVESDRVVYNLIFDREHILYADGLEVLSSTA